jgi:hypothetical protein
MEDEHGPLVGIEPDERTTHRLGLNDPVAKEASLRSNLRSTPPRVRVVERDLPDCSALRSSKLATASVDQDLGEPGIETPGVAETRELAPRVDARILDHISRKRLVADDSARDPEESLEARRDQLLEGVVIAARRPNDQGRLQVLTIGAVRRRGRHERPVLPTRSP